MLRHAATQARVMVSVHAHWITLHCKNSPSSLLRLDHSLVNHSFAYFPDSHPLPLLASLMHSTRSIKPSLHHSPR